MRSVELAAVQSLLDFQYGIQPELVAVLGDVTEVHSNVLLQAVDGRSDGSVEVAHCVGLKTDLRG